MSRTRPLSFLFATVALMTLFLAGRPADAHSGIQSYVYVSLFDDGMEGRVEYPIDDIGAVLGIDFPEDDDAALAAAAERYDEIVAYTDAHLDMGRDGRNWVLQFQPDPQLLAIDEPVGDYVQVGFTVVEDFDEPPREWTVTYDGIIESNPERDALFLIEDDWTTGTFRNEGEHLVGFSVNDETQLVQLDSPSRLEPWSELASRGSTAIDTAPDQVVGVLAVLVPIALLGGRRRNQQLAPPVADTVATAARRVGLVVLGQSAVLWICGLLESAPSARVAGVAVALGVGLAAVTGWVNARLARVLTVGVGALLGVGLGHVFVEQLLFRSRPFQSLVAFNVGIIATVLFVAALALPSLMLLGRLRIAPRLHMFASGAVAIASLIWLIERITDIEFPVRTIEIRGVQALTNPIVMAVLTGVVAAVVLTRKGDALRPSAEEAGPARHDERIEVP